VGVLIELEGIDGSGKGTQAQRLVKRLTDEGWSVELFSFPRYTETAFGKIVGDFLNGRFGSLEEVDPFVAALFYAGDRFESRRLLKAALDKTDVVVCDRYVASNVAHQAAKLENAEQQAELIEWVERLEFDVFGLPRPDLVLLLDVPVEVSQQLIAHKEKRSYTDRKADLQEANLSYLEKVRRLYHQLAQRPQWRLVECVKQNQLLSVDAVHELLWQEVSRLLNKNEPNVLPN